MQTVEVVANGNLGTHALAAVKVRHWPIELGCARLVHVDHRAHWRAGHVARGRWCWGGRR